MNIPQEALYQARLGVDDPPGAVADMRLEEAYTPLEEAVVDARPAGAGDARQAAKVVLAPAGARASRSCRV